MDKDAHIRREGRFPSAKEVDGALRAAFNEAARDQAQRVASRLNHELQARLPDHPAAAYALVEGPQGAPVLKLTNPEHAPQVKRLELGDSQQLALGLIAKQQAQARARASDVQRQIRRLAHQKLFGGTKQHG